MSNLMKNIIEVHDLKKYYGKGKNLVKAVDGISLTIRENEIFGFLGPNGAGKTTSLRMIIGLLKPDEGQVKILGKDQHTNGKNVKQLLGIIPQSLTFYSDLTVEENLWFLAKIYDIPKKEAMKRIDSLILQIGLENKRKALVKSLSGGQQRRLNLILGLVHNPQIVLCDEPTPGLDPQSRKVVWDMIKRLPGEGKTVILTTHYIEEADRLADRVAIIDNGKILVLDNPRALKASVGEGDIVELYLEGGHDDSELISILNDLKSDESKFIIEDTRILSQDLIQIRALDLIPKLSHILNFLEDNGLSIENMSIRNTSLEDVFIHLTGRSLRS
ncbi:MAG: ABC transporter ATP-binding protein [Candidatus Hodarchaeales archaeon]